MSPKRIQLRRTKGWRLPAGAVSVARPTRWGNPWTVGQVIHRRISGQQRGSAAGLYDGAADLWFELPLADVPLSAAEAVALYRADLTYVLNEAAEDYPDVVEALAKLRGKDLACWCPLDQPCHADVLLELANEDRS